MKQMPCNLIKDLLPLYADGVVSEETAQIVANHLAECPDCQAEYEQMRQAIELPANPELREESVHALKQMKHHLKHKKLLISITSIVATVFLLWGGFLVYQNVGPVHDFFSPSIWVDMRDCETDDWMPLEFQVEFGGAATTDELNFDSIFFRHMVTNDHLSAPVQLRISEPDGSVVLETALDPAETISLDGLQRNHPYHVDFKTTGDNLFLIFN